MQSLRRIAFRRAPAPSRPSPLPVRSVGHYVVGSDHLEPVRKRWFFQIFWCVSGEGRFFWKNRWHRLSPGWVFIHAPEEIHRIERLSPVWEYRWFTSDGNNVDLWMRECGVAERHFNAGTCPAVLFNAIHQSIEDPDPAAESRCSGLAFSILLAMQRDTRPAVAAKDPPHQIRDAIDARFMDGNLTVEALAARHGMHRSTLYRQFRASFGISPVRYLRDRRTQRALSLLQETSLPIIEVAQLSGFNSHPYFCQIIHQATGHTPTALRQQNRTP